VYQHRTHNLLPMLLAPLFPLHEKSCCLGHHIAHALMPTPTMASALLRCRAWPDALPAGATVAAPLLYLPIAAQPHRCNADPSFARRGGQLVYLAFQRYRETQAFKKRVSPAMLRKNIMRSTKEQQKNHTWPVNKPSLFDSTLSDGIAAGDDKRSGAGTRAAGDLVTNLSDNLKVCASTAVLRKRGSAVCLHALYAFRTTLVRAPASAPIMLRWRCCTEHTERQSCLYSSAPDPHPHPHPHSSWALPEPTPAG
jgi:hypothetical protein